MDKIYTCIHMYVQVKCWNIDMLRICRRFRFRCRRFSTPGSPGARLVGNFHFRRWKSRAPPFFRRRKLEPSPHLIITFSNWNYYFLFFSSLPQFSPAAPVVIPIFLDGSPENYFVTIVSSSSRRWHSFIFVVVVRRFVSVRVVRILWMPQKNM